MSTIKSNYLKEHCWFSPKMILSNTKHRYLSRN